MRLQLYIKNIRKNGKRCFTIQDIIKEFKVSPGSARVMVSNLLKSGDLISPVRGFYVVVPPEHQPYGSIPAKELIPLIIEHIKVNYYVSLLTAGLFYGATHQKPAQFQIISDKRIKRRLIFGKVEITFIYKKNMLDLPVNDFVVSTGYLRVATPELMLLDLLSYPEHAGGLNHIATVLSELIESLNVKKLISLAKKIKMEHQLQRIGYILDNIELIEDKHTASFINVLAKHIEKNRNNYVPLASEISITGYPRSKKWKVIINTDIESDL